VADWEERFGDYVERLGDALGHADRRAPLRAYATGLLLPGERKSVEPMAARVDPFRVGAAHQSLHHLVAKAAWDDAALLRAVRDYVLPAMLERGPIRAWLVDDTGLPKKGTLSVGVARQYCGQLGKRENCQVAVTLSVANEHASLPVAYRLYLPEGWAADPARRAMAGVPEAIAFRTKPEIALDQVRQAVADGVPPGVVVTDAGYGNDTDFRDGVTALGLPYVAGIQGSTSLWPPGTAPPPARPWSGRGRPPKRLRRDPEHQPLAAETVALALPAGAWRVEDGHLAAGHGRATGLAPRRRPGPPGARRLPPQRAAGRGVAPDRVARRRGRAGQVLALHPARGRHARGAGRRGEAALADRARLRGAQAGDRPGPLRGPRLARLPPPRRLVHRRLRPPGGRALPLFPSRLAAPAPGSRAAGRLPPPRLTRCAPSGTVPPRSRPRAGTSRSR
jgi:SRSO17 transposase